MGISSGIIHIGRSGRARWTGRRSSGRTHGTIQGRITRIRYYNVGRGRFARPDPYKAGAGPGTPGSRNRPTPFPAAPTTPTPYTSTWKTRLVALLSRAEPIRFGSESNARPRIIIPTQASPSRRVQCSSCRLRSVENTGEYPTVFIGSDVPKRPGPQGHLGLLRRDSCLLALPGNREVQTLCCSR